MICDSFNHYINSASISQFLLKRGIELVHLFVWFDETGSYPARTIVTIFASNTYNQDRLKYSELVIRDLPSQRLRKGEVCPGLQKTHPKSL